MVALLVVLLGITVIVGSWKLGSGWTSDGPGAGIPALQRHAAKTLDPVPDPATASQVATTDQMQASRRHRAAGVPQSRLGYPPTAGPSRATRQQTTDDRGARCARR